MSESSFDAGFDAGAFSEVYEKLRGNVELAVRGKPAAVRLALTCLLAGGHLLVEDVPGVGKTTLAKAIAASIDQASWHRIQFTPDLLPSDITGTPVYQQKTQTFEFRPGPIFANLVVADEVNRASPKTQSAMLEVMQEHQVTADGTTYPMPEPFLVLATQNPIDLEGTYRLPEAQLDRFLLRLQIGYPDLAEEQAILTDRAAAAGEPPTLRPVATLDEVRRMVQHAARVHAADAVTGYIARIAEATRKRPELRLGASTRASLALLRVSQAWAATEGRRYVTPDDVKAVAEPALGHRMLLNPEAEMRGSRVESVLREVLEELPVPVAE